MSEVPDKVATTALTERQAEVLALRAAGRTQSEIGELLGTSVANVSAVERAARENVEAARRTIELMRVLKAHTRVGAEAGTDLRNLVDRIYEAADEMDVRVAYTDPELTAVLHERLGDRIDGRQLSSDIEVGLTDEGSIVVFPRDDSASLTGTPE